MHLRGSLTGPIGDVKEALQVEDRVSP